jgi:hypothetical protein
LWLQELLACFCMEVCGESGWNFGLSSSIEVAISVVKIWPRLVRDSRLQLPLRGG